MEIQKIGVIGCGLMGHGIVQVAAQAGFSVLAVEMDDTALRAGMTRIEKSLRKLTEKAAEKGQIKNEEIEPHISTTLERIRPSLRLEDLREVDLVIEAIVEDLEVKKRLFRDLGATCRPETLLASNTSSFPIRELALASERPSRTLGLHFFNPVQLMKLVEIVQSDETSKEAIQAARTFVTTSGKVPIECKDTPGFVVNRLLVPFIAQALLLLERGDANAEDIDTAMQLGCGHPMGPITLADYVGLDTSLFILEGWCERYPNEAAFQVPEILREKVSQGKLGRKTGEGFFLWDGDKKAEA